VPQLIFRNSSKVKGSKVKVTRQLNAVTENKPYLQNGKACKSPLAGVWAYCGGRTTGRAVCCTRMCCLWRCKSTTTRKEKLLWMTPDCSSCYRRPRSEAGYSGPLPPVRPSVCLFTRMMIQKALPYLVSVMILGAPWCRCDFGFIRSVKAALLEGGWA